MVAYVREHAEAISLMHNVSLIRLALRRFGVQLPAGLAGEIAQLRAERWGPRVQAHAALASRAKTEQYEALRTHLQPVLHWLRTISVDEFRAACDVWLARREENQEIASPSIGREVGLLRSLNARELHMWGSGTRARFCRC